MFNVHLQHHLLLIYQKQGLSLVISSYIHFHFTSLSFFAICFVPFFYTGHVMLLQLFLQFACFCLHVSSRVMVYCVQSYSVVYRIHIVISTFTDFLLGISKCFSLLVCGFSSFFLSFVFLFLLFIQIHT